MFRRAVVLSLTVGVLTGVAVAASPEGEQSWPAPPPAQKNVLTRVLFPERPSAELDSSEANVRRLVGQLALRDAHTVHTAFAELFWIGEAVRPQLAPLAERLQSTPKLATQTDAFAYKVLRSIDRWNFCRSVATTQRLVAPVIIGTPRWMRGKSWKGGLVGKPKAVTLQVNTGRFVTYGTNYRGMELRLINRSGATLNIVREASRIDCVAEAETDDGWVAIETAPKARVRRPLVWKLKHDFVADSAVPLYTGSLKTRVRYRLSLYGSKEPIYSNVFDAAIDPAQLTGKPGRLKHDYTPR